MMLSSSRLGLEWKIIRWLSMDPSTFQMLNSLSHCTSTKNIFWKNAWGGRQREWLIRRIWCRELCMTAGASSRINNKPLITRKQAPKYPATPIHKQRAWKTFQQPSAATIIKLSTITTFPHLRVTIRCASSQGSNQATWGEQFRCMNSNTI